MVLDSILIHMDSQTILTSNRVSFFPLSGIFRPKNKQTNKKTLKVARTLKTIVFLLISNVKLRSQQIKRSSIYKMQSKILSICISFFFFKLFCFLVYLGVVSFGMRVQFPRQFVPILRIELFSVYQLRGQILVFKP